MLNKSRFDLPRPPGGRRNPAASAVIHGQSALDVRRYADAEAWFREALVLAPNSPEARRGLGYALFQLNRLEEALAILDDAVRRNPGDMLARLLLGRLCLRLHEPAAAEQHFQRILKMIPASAPARSGLVDAAIASGKLNEARRIANQLLTLDPNSEAGLFAHARLCEIQGQHLAAKAHYDQLVKLSPANPGHRYHRSRTLLRLGEFDAGWSDYEQRFGAGAVQAPSVSTPRWSGERVGHLLLIAEQGFGDTIQFARFISQAKPLADRLSLACPAAMATLLARSFNIDTIDSERGRWPDHDAHLPLLSLPHVLRLGVQALQPAGRYLLPDPQRQASWSRSLQADSDKLNVGVVHATSVAHATEQRPQTRRSCTTTELQPLATFGVNLIDLQIGAKPVAGWQGLSNELADFDDTTALIDLLDVVVSVDTVAAHIGGALGKPVALLLPCAADWRWMEAPDTTDWYPSIRLFRQSDPGNWGPPIARVRTFLEQLIV